MMYALRGTWAKGGLVTMVVWPCAKHHPGNAKQIVLTTWEDYLSQAMGIRAKCKQDRVQIQHNVLTSFMDEPRARGVEDGRTGIGDK